jgi:hypothetical protein
LEKTLASRLRIYYRGGDEAERWSVTEQVRLRDVQEAYTESDWRKTMAEQSGNGKRELIDTGTDKRYVRRDAQG